jgi:hypothetical protein
MWLCSVRRVFMHENSMNHTLCIEVYVVYCKYWPCNFLVISRDDCAQVKYLVHEYTNIYYLRFLRYNRIAEPSVTSNDGWGHRGFLGE